ncbi:hypothetical protein [Streptomyces angustmyceticus]|uniref:hypothetical protein n=1 Tax=Streptomyces angustmyceticus TaxID=285578 RepID=UPI003D9345DA
MIAPRAAVPEDAAELVRLRELIFRAMNGREVSGSWERDAPAPARQPRRPWPPPARPAFPARPGREMRLTPTGARRSDGAP